MKRYAELGIPTTVCEHCDKPIWYAVTGQRWRHINDEYFCNQELRTTAAEPKNAEPSVTISEPKSEKPRKLRLNYTFSIDEPLKVIRELEQHTGYTTGQFLAGETTEDKLCSFDSIEWSFRLAQVKAFIEDADRIDEARREEAAKESERRTLREAITKMMRDEVAQIAEAKIAEAKIAEAKIAQAEKPWRVGYHTEELLAIRPSGGLWGVMDHKGWNVSRGYYTTPEKAWADFDRRFGPKEGENL